MRVRHRLMTHSLFLSSYMPVTCWLHASGTILKGFCSVLGLFRVAQLHASYMSYAQVATENSRKWPQTTARTIANSQKKPNIDLKQPQTTENSRKWPQERPQIAENNHKNDRKRLKYDSSYAPNSSSPFWLIIHFLPLGDFVSRLSFDIDSYANSTMFVVDIVISIGKNRLRLPSYLPKVISVFADKW